MPGRSAAIEPVIEVVALQVGGIKRAPYSLEVEQVLAAGKVPNVYVFAGANAWRRANIRREQRGPGSALVLPDDEEPSSLRWPPVEAVVVCWPTSEVPDYPRRLELAQALIRDNVKFASIENHPDWMSIRCKGEGG